MPAATLAQFYRPLLILRGPEALALSDLALAAPDAAIEEAVVKATNGFYAIATLGRCVPAQVVPLWGPEDRRISDGRHVLAYSPAGGGYAALAEIGR
jgi:hypothetical protein